MVAEAPPGGVRFVIDVLLLFMLLLLLVALVFADPVVDVELLLLLVADMVELVPVEDDDADVLDPPVVLVELDWLLFMPDVAPGTLLVVVLPELWLPTIAPPGTTVTEPRFVPVVLPVALPVVLVLALAELEVVALELVTLNDPAAALPNVSAAITSTLPAGVVSGTVTVAVRPPLAVELVDCTTCPSM
jgi:hypothetical protein